MLSVACSAFLSGCTAPGPLRKIWPFGKGIKYGAIKEFIPQDRFDQVRVVNEVAGSGKLLFIKKTKTIPVVTGYIVGEVFDKDGRPAKGLQVITRDMVGGSGGGSGALGSVGIVQSDGKYQLPFALSIDKLGKATVQGKFLVNPKWEEEIREKGYSYRPAVNEQAPVILEYTFHLYYNGKIGVIALYTDLPKRLVVTATRSTLYEKMKNVDDQEQLKAKEKEEAEKKRKSEAGGGFEGMPGFPP